MSVIKPQHNIPLTTAIAASTPSKGSLVTSLYHELERLYFQKEDGKGNVIRTRIVLKPEDGDAPGLERVIATVTDQELGLFIQFNGTLDTTKQPPKPVEGPYLTYGKKFLTEFKNPQLQNTATKLWR